MKKTLLLVLPFLFIFIMSCETDDDETSGGLVGTWTVDSVTYYVVGVMKQMVQWLMTQLASMMVILNSFLVALYRIVLMTVVIGKMTTLVITLLQMNGIILTMRIL